MLVHPEISALLNRLSRSEREEPAKTPRVARGGAIDKDGAEKPKIAALYAPADMEPKDEVDYLNERDSQLNFYA